MNNKGTKWTPQEIETLKTHYPTGGAKEINKRLGRTKRAIQRMADLLNVKYIPNLPIEDKYLQEFYHITKPEVAYFLGYWWADAHVSKENNNLLFSITENDGIDIKDEILKVIPFNFSVYKLKTRPNSQKTMTFRKGDKNLHKFLSENDYQIKSKTSPEKILQKIPKHLHSFWWQGYFDGDGCLYLHNGSHPRISITGPKKQNWEFYKNLCKQLGIKFKISISTNGVGSWSKIYIQNIKECTLFLNYIYQKRIIGLKRKYNKYLQFKNKIRISKQFPLQEES